MITLDDIVQARIRIAHAVRETPINHSPQLSEFSGNRVHLKLEHLQTTGSFKLRGASNAVLSLTAVQRKLGVVGVSTGNHGRGLAHAAKQADVRCIICMSSLVPQNKIDGIRALGAEVRIVGRSQDEAQIEVNRLVTEEGMTMVPPFDHPAVIAGQGTLALEMLEQLPDVGCVVVPVSGGGLIAGIATALKAKNRNIKVVGITMERGAAMYQSVQAGKPVLVEELPTLADSLGGGIGLNNNYTFNAVKNLVDDFVLVNEREIAAAIRHAYWHEKTILEGSGAVCIAAVLSGKLRLTCPTLLLLSGGNIDMTLHHRIISGEDVDVT